MTNCYKYHHREDLLPSFSDEEAIEQVDTKPPLALSVVNGATHVVAASQEPVVSKVLFNQIGTWEINCVSLQLANALVQNSDGTVSIVQLDTSTNQIVQLADGTAQLAQVETSTVAQTATGVHTLAEVAAATAEQQQTATLELAGTTTGEITQEGHILIAGEDGQGMSKVDSMWFLVT